jgi:exodeoxyribonuclease-1
LDRLAPANGFDHSNAHDAMADVEATIHVARLVRERAPRLWSNALRFSEKISVAAFLDAEPCFVLTESFYNLPYQFALTKLGHEPGNTGDVLALNLALDIDQLRAMTDGELVTRLARSPKPVRRIRTNAAPTLQPLSEYEHFGDVTADDLLERADRIRTDTEFCARLIRLSAREAWPASEFVEQQIYSGLVSRSDEARMAAFHRGAWEKRAGLVAEFEDVRLRVLGGRLVFEHRADLLHPDHRRKLAEKMAQRMAGEGHERPAWTTVVAAHEEASLRLEQGNHGETEILTGVLEYLAKFMPHEVFF